MQNVHLVKEQTQTYLDSKKSFPAKSSLRFMNDATFAFYERLRCSDKVNKNKNKNKKPKTKNIT